MHNRTLTALTIGLATAGITLAGASRHPAATAPTTTAAAGLLLMLTALPPLAAAGRRHTATRCAAAYNNGYRCGILHARDILTPTSATRVDISSSTGRHTE